MSHEFNPQRSLTEVLEQRRALQASNPSMASRDFARKIHQQTENSVHAFASFVKEKLSSEETKRHGAIAEKEEVLPEFLAKLVFSASEAFHTRSPQTTQLQAVFQNLAFFDLTNSLRIPTEGVTLESFQKQVQNLDNQAKQVVEKTRALLQDPIIADSVNLYVNKILQESGYQVSRDTIVSLEGRVEGNKAHRQTPVLPSVEEAEALLRNGLSRAIMAGSAVEANALIDQFDLGLTKTTPQPLFKKPLRP